MFKGRLYPYQQPVVPHFANRGSLLLAFAPGTGKTPTAIACAEYLFDEGDISQCLIICPASLKYQWVERIAQFTDNRLVIVIDGDKEVRNQQYKKAIRFNYVIISYDYVLFDAEHMTSLYPHMVVLDEASAIKSFKTQRSKKIKKIFKDVPYRLALTATPIENKPEELFSIMQWVDSSVLGRYDLFEKTYITRNPKGWVSSYKNLDVLNKRLGDSMIRKSKDDPDVAPFLPKSHTDNWIVPLDPKVAKVYCEIAQDMLHELSVIPHWEMNTKNPYEAEDTPPGRLMAMHMVLEMLLCDPRLIDWSAKAYLNEKPEGSEYAYLLSKSGSLKGLPLKSDKLLRLEEELNAILANPKSKVLIYSKYKYMLELLRMHLPFKSVLFTGDMSPKQKDAARQQFANDVNNRLFLSSYAGGYGLDMNMADYLINFDLPWSFGAQDQINSRHIRASSLFDQVYIRNILVHDSIEERKMRMLERKRKMSEIAIDGTHTEDTSVYLDADFLRDHLTAFIGMYSRG